jgi:hypothetical protein
MLWPLTITCIDESGNRLPGAAIQVRETLNPSVSVPTYDIDYQLVTSPVAGPTGMATVFLRNGYIDSRYVLDPYESEWITDLALAPSGRAGRWRDDVGGAIAAGDVTDFTITVPDLGVEKTPRSVAVAMDLTHPDVSDLELSLVAPDLSSALLAPRDLMVPGALDGAIAFNPSGDVFDPSPGSAPGLTTSVTDTDTTFPTSDSFTHAMTFYARVQASGGSLATSEIVHVTDATTATWTVVRGQFGTTALAYAPGDSLVVMAELVDGRVFSSLGSAPNNGEGDWKLRIDDSGAAGGTLNNWTLTFPPNLSFS